MGKALTGAAELAGAVGMGALAAFQPELVALPFYTSAMGALGMSGLAMEAGAIASAISGGRGQNITTRQPASYRQIVYGTQRIGGIEIYRSTTGSHRDQYNFVIVLATHQLYQINALYLDGRLVYWIPGSTGYSTHNGSDFGGTCDSSDHTGPDGQIYNFGGNVYCEARFGDQLPGDVIGGLTANDPTWTGSSGRTPYVGGCTYVYLKIEYDPANFPQLPEIRFAVKGKPILDPRTGLTAYSHNPALIVNDIFTDADFGLGDSTVNQDQLIAAANICEEQVTSFVGLEDRYAAHWHYDTSTAPGDAIGTFMQAMGGRLSRVGGEWYIYPAAYTGPSVTLGADHLLTAPRYSETRAYRELYNRVNGTYTAPNYPYNAAGDLYDINGYAAGLIQNNWNYAFQQTNYPQYACDVLHGYASDQFLADDGAVQLPKELGLPAVLSVSQAQRLAKIWLLRNRQQGTGQFTMSLPAFALAPNDTFLMSFARNGWDEKLFEVTGTQFRVEANGDQPPDIRITLEVAETDASVYEWNTAEELTQLVTPAFPTLRGGSVVAPPTNLVLTSSAATAVVAPDGTVTPRIEVEWTTPFDVLVTQLQLRFRVSGTTAWVDGGTVSATSNLAYLPVQAGQTYDVAIRSLRSSGAASVWVEQDNFTAGLVLGITAATYALAPSSLVGEAFSNGTAAIECQPFTASLGGHSVSYFPSGYQNLAGLLQGTLYSVYVVDPNLAGGDLTPVATRNKNDYLGKFGYWWIGDVTTPVYSSGGSSTLPYVFTTATDTGSRSTVGPDDAFDGDTTTYAVISGQSTANKTGTGTFSYGSCIFGGLPAQASSSVRTLNVDVAVEIDVPTGTTGDIGDATITLTIGSTGSTLLSAGATTARATYTGSIPAGQDMSQVTVTVTATPVDISGSTPAAAQRAAVTISLYELTIT